MRKTVVRYKLQRYIPSQEITSRQSGEYSRLESSLESDEAGLQQIGVVQVSVVAALPTQGVGQAPALRSRNNNNGDV